MRVDDVEVGVSNLILDQGIPDANEACREDARDGTDWVDAGGGGGVRQEGHSHAGANDSDDVYVGLHETRFIENHIAHVHSELLRLYFSIR